MSYRLDSRIFFFSPSAKMQRFSFLLGINTKQLSNQMLDLTKVINELKDVLIQQVRSPRVPLPLNLCFPTSEHSFLVTWLHCMLMLKHSQVKETSFLRNTISECQACGKIILSLSKKKKKTKGYFSSFLIIKKCDFNLLGLKALVDPRWWNPVVPQGCVSVTICV